MINRSFILRPSVMALFLFALFAAPIGTGATTAQAAESTNADTALKFVKDTAEAGLTFLSNPQTPKEQKTAEFKKLLNNSFDLDTIGRFALGGYWNTATPAQQQEYQALFRKMVVQVYSNRFDEYKGQKFEVKSARAISNNDSLVNSVMIPTDGGENVAIDWRVRNKSGTNKIVDVYVAGVSMGVTQRSDFSSVIQNGGGNISVLIDYLKKKF